MTDARDARAPRASDWPDIVEVLHALTNTITVRSHYAEGHPAIAQADETAALGLSRVLDRLPELVVAILDDDFVVCERPLPDLRDRLSVLARSMGRHQIECIVFQRGTTLAECKVLGRTLATPEDAAGSARVRETAQDQLLHVLLRFAALRSGADDQSKGTSGAFFVPAALDVLVGAARALAEGAPLDKLGVLSLANQIVVACSARGVMLQQRAWTRSIEDEAAHAANVAMMTAAMCLEAGYPQRTSVDAAAAALLHDIGHLFLPAEIRGVPELLLDERAVPVFRNHTFAGATMLLGAACSPLWIAAALEHHRGVDGEGYPALDGRDPPHELVRVVSLANFFDRKRTIVNGMGSDPEDAIAAATALEERYFGKSMVRRFVRALGAFPPGTTVELSDRTPAIVTRARGGDALRPEVRLLLGPLAGRAVDLKDLDAQQGRHVRSIVRAIAPPMLLPADAVIPEAPRAEPPRVTVDEPPPLVFDARRSAAGPVGADKARGELGHMEALLDALLTVPTDALVTNTAPPPAISVPPAATPSMPPIVAPSWSPPEPAPPRAPPPARSIPPLAAVPQVLVDAATLARLALDHRAVFVLRFVDGMSSIEDIIDACGLPRADAAPLIEELFARGVIGVAR